SAAAIIAFLGVGIVAAEGGTASSARPITAPPRSAPSAIGAAAAANATANVASAEASAQPRDFDPALVHCHDLSRGACMAVARAATREGQDTGSTTERVVVWRSFLCR